MAGPGGMSIGALSQATGIPAATLRTWERRYGVPTSHRTEGGHRVYGPEAVEHLRWVARALAAGHRPAQALTMAPEALRGLLERPAQGPGGEVDWVRAIERLDGPGLVAALRRAWSSRGAMSFLIEELAPFLAVVGTGWKSGRIDVLHEHFGTERLRGFLAEHWQALSDTNAGPVAVLGNLPGERHDLGLHMAATVLALAGWRVVFLGADTPLASLVGAVERSGARVLVVSVSDAADPAAVAYGLDILAAGVGLGVALLVGGAGAPAGHGERIVDLRELAAWAEGAAR